MRSPAIAGYCSVPNRATPFRFSEFHMQSLKDYLPVRENTAVEGICWKSLQWVGKPAKNFSSAGLVDENSAVGYTFVVLCLETPWLDHCVEKLAMTIRPRRVVASAPTPVARNQTRIKHHFAMLLTRRVEYYQPPHCHTTTLITRPGPSHLLDTLHRTVTHTPCPAKYFRQYSSNRLNSSIPRFTSPMPITTPLLVSPF
ncbi:unnamed protein product, partial [Ectocarpus sp. 8 AP-2014]